jgi:DNA polymerase III alpha subunit (gram-positive type)
MPGSWRYVRAPRKNKLTDPGRRWSDKKRQEAVIAYIASGSYLVTSEQTGIPKETIHTWSQTPWWKEKIADIQQQDYDKLDSRLTNVLDKVITGINDRVTAGDYQYDPVTGKIKRIPVKLRELNQSMSMLIDKRQLIRKQPTKIVEQTSTASQLQDLAKKFSEFVTGKIKEEGVKELVAVCVEGENVFKNVDGTWEVKE